jgi:cyclopropane fatty-acyl-phospholipid synthase-like methyltransferase
MALSTKTKVGSFAARMVRRLSRAAQKPQLTERPDDDGWTAYWEALGDRQQLFREQAAEYVQNLTAVIKLDRSTRVLDFGCGFGFVADYVAPLVGRLFVWDASANMRGRALKTVAHHSNTQWLDLSEQEVFPSGVHLDLILVNSVVQYMTVDQFSAWLSVWREMLAPAGRIVVSDIISPDAGSLREIIDILKLSARRGFLARALWQSAREIGRYRNIRKACPLTRMRHSEIKERARAAGLEVSFLPRNLTHFPKRITAVIGLHRAGEQ